MSDRAAFAVFNISHKGEWVADGFKFKLCGNNAS